MRTTDVKTEFLNTFPAKYREHIVEFAKMVESSDADVLMFTARKAACFFHCLEHLRIWSSAGKTIVSERAKDHDLSWVKGKHIAIVDEVIVTGTNLADLISALRAHNAASVRVFALFVNTDWFVDDFLNEAKLTGFVPLKSSDAQALGTTIVEALHVVPRPYAVDYPITSIESISRSQFIRLMDSTDWRLRLTYCKSLEGGHDAARRVEYYSAFPRFSIQEIANSLGIAEIDAIVCKVRLYGRWDATGNPAAPERYHFRVVPYFILPPLETSSLDAIFLKLIKPLSKGERTLLQTSCVNEKSRLRVVQYVVAAWLAALWIRDQQRMGLSASFTNDGREIHYVFPHEVHGAIQSLCNYSRIDDIRRVAPEPLNEVGDTQLSETTYNTFETLLRPFANMYQRKEMKLRALAKRHRRRVLEDAKFRSISNRLNEGVSVPELQGLLQLPSAAAKEAVSEFLDFAIDHGHVVPVTITRSTKDQSSQVVLRGFRHGEETYLVLKDREVFWLMLSSFYESVRKILAEDSKVPAGPLFKIGAAPKVYIEKILVLFLRFGLQEGIFNQAFTGEGAAEGRMLVRVGADLHGSRLTIGKESPTEMSQENAFVGWLVENDILRKHQSGGFVLGDHKSFNDGPDKTKKGKSKQFGILMGDVITQLLKNPNPDQPGLSPSKRANSALVALSTCETASSTIIAIGAELRRTHKELGAFPLDRDTLPRDLLPAVSRSRGAFADARTAANSAYLKAKLYLTRQSERSSQHIDRILSESSPMSASVWETASESFRRIWGRATVRDENHRIVLLLDLAIPLQFTVHFLEFAVLSACSHLLSESLAQRLAHLPSVIDEMLDDLHELSTMLVSAGNNQIFYAAAGSALGKLEAAIRRDWSDRLNSPADEQLPALAETLARLLLHAEASYLHIDATYNQRGQIAPVRMYESGLLISVLDSSEADKVKELIQRAVERCSTGGPRGYSRPGQNAQLSAGITFRETTERDGHRFEIFLTGAGGAVWSGYIAAETLKACQAFSNEVRVCAALAMEDGYAAIVGCHDGNLNIAPNLPGLWEEQVSTLRAARGTVIAQAEGRSGTGALSDFESSFDSTLKSDIRRTKQASVVQSRQLGGNMETRIYQLNGATHLDRVAFVFTVQDELSTFLSYLKDSGITPRRQAPSATDKMAWYSTVGKPNSEFEVVAVLNREMGSHDAAALLGEVERRFSPAATILIGIAAALTGKSEHLGDVVIPAKVLDAHQSVSLPTGEQNRSFDRPFPQKVRELLQGFFVENVARDRLQGSTFGVVEHRVRMNITESDAALLRNDSKRDRRRSAASHSDKVDAYEMEAAGVVAYMENSPTAPPTFVVKGLSDLGDPKKSDSEIRYTAARNAVVVALTLAEYVLGVERPKQGSLL